MRKKHLLRALCFVLVLLASITQAASLNGRSFIGIRGGFAGSGGETKAIIAGTSIETSTNASGGMGGVTFGHWVAENMAVTIDVFAISTDIDTKIDIANVSTHSGGVAGIHTGIRYYFPKSSFDGSWRPYVSASVGPYIGDETNTSITTGVSVETKTQYAFGSQLGGGVDILLSRLFMLGIHTGYNLMTDFSDPIGGKKNYSSPEFSLGLSILFGKGK